MQGLKTQGSDKFRKFWNIVQSTANKQNKRFFMDCGEGREIMLEDIEGEDIRGWLIPFEQVEKFEKEWNRNEISNRWIDNITWAEWKQKNETITIEFNNYN